MKILIAEDDEMIMLSYVIALKSRNHEVFQTTDGEECLRVFMDLESSGEKGKNPFDLVILDHRMPKKTGIEVAEKILSITPTQRVIIASAYTHELKIPSKIEQCLELVQKPFGIDDLFSMVESATQTSTTGHGQRPVSANNNLLREGYEMPHENNDDQTRSLSDTFRLDLLK